MKYTAGGIGKAYGVLGVPFGICMGIVFGVQFGAVNGIVSGTACSVLFCGFMILTMQRINKKYLTDAAGDAEDVFGTVEAHAAVHSAKSCMEIRKTLTDFAKVHAWSIAVCGDYEIHIRTRASFRSWGERIVILASETDDGTTELCVSSRPKVRTALFDFGVNKANIEMIKTAVSGS